MEWNVNLGVSAPKYSKRCAATRQKAESMIVIGQGRVFEKDYSKFTTTGPRPNFLFSSKSLSYFGILVAGAGSNRRPWDYEYYALKEPMDWFNEHLEHPYSYGLEPARLAGRSLCWFRHTAKEHLSRAWEMAAFLEDHDIYIRTIKTQRPGYILYEDEAQVLAFPYSDIRRLLY